MRSARTKPITLVLVALLWTAAAEQTLAITYTTLDYPGSLTTFANGIDGNNIVGFYNNSSGAHGFLYNGATYTTLDHPLATNGTIARAISGGNIVGFYNNSSGGHGFLYNGTTYTTLDFPGGSQTGAFGIDGNNIVGFYSDSTKSHGFRYDGATYTTLDDPLATGSTFARGIDGNNIVGSYNGAPNGFLYGGTTYTTLDYPGSLSTQAFGIDGKNIVGFYTGPSGGHGFLYDGTTYTTLNYPLGTGVTNAYGIDGNNIVGAYTIDSSGSSGFHGFLATVPEPSTGVLGVITCGLMWCWRKRFRMQKRWKWCIGNQQQARSLLRTKPITLVLAALLWTAAAEQTLAITYTTLDYPGSLSTLANGIDGNNIVGAYRDSSNIFHGFLYNGATYTTLDHPLATSGTIPRGISGGNIVGFYNNSSGGHGFLYNGTTYTTLDFPGSSQTGAYGIDGSKIVGVYSDGSKNHGFLYNGTTYTTLDDPLATNGTRAHGIDGNNIVGFYTGHGFLYDGTTYTTLDYPGSPSTTIAFGIDGKNIVGSSDGHGFLYDGSTYTTLDYPVIPGETNAYGIDGNNIVGAYATDSSGFHGFLATVPEPSTGVLSVIACGLMWCWRKRLAKVAMHRTFASLILFCAISLVAFQSASAVTIPTVPIGNAGNGNDPLVGNLFGGVAYSYRIGTTEVTNVQYAAFLSQKAKSDPLGLYNVSMGSGNGGITRSGSSPNFVYTPIAGRGNMPVNFVSWYDSIRFANWLNNGQGTGGTETGAYTLTDATITRNLGATWFLPSIDEWYKAAYHKNDGVTDNYFVYPTSSDAAPTGETPPGGSNSANIGFHLGVDDLTNVGAYIDTKSPYGAFDMAGNVLEWLDRPIDSGTGTAALWGGSWSGMAQHTRSDHGSAYIPEGETGSIGFRVATVPEPSTAVLGVIACGLMWCWRKRFR